MPDNKDTEGTLTGAFSSIIADLIDTRVHSILADQVGKRITQLEGQMQKAIEDARRGNVVRYEITKPDAKKVDVGVQHFQFKKLMDIVTSGRIAYLAGEASSGKSTACGSVAKALGLKAYYITGSEESSIYEYVGYKDAVGNYHGTAWRQAFEHGGIAVLDEIDNYNSATMVALNSAMEQRIMLFPDKMIRAHEDFRVIATGNTKGTGGTSLYQRRTLDGATLDRFVILDWPIDEAFEEALFGKTDWLTYIRAVRQAVKVASISHIVSMRSTRDGHTLFAKGWRTEDVEEAVLWKGITEDARARVKENLELAPPKGEIVLAQLRKLNTQKKEG